VAERATARRTVTAEAVPLVPWRSFLADFMTSWPANAKGQAEHVTFVGPTKQGKTTLALEILKERARIRDAHIVVLATKPRDLTLSRLGWPVIRQWPPGYGQKQVIFWPRFAKDVRRAAYAQRLAFDPVLADIFADGNRVVYIDEAFYFTDTLGLGSTLKQYWTQGRSVNLIVVAGTQRPRGVPREMFSEASWFFAFRTADEDELRRVSEIGGVDTRWLREVMRTLKPHEFVAVQTRTGVMVRSMVR
jgi:DNA helicase HerA-like ATPase